MLGVPVSYPGGLEGINRGLPSQPQLLTKNKKPPNRADSGLGQQTLPLGFKPTFTEETMGVAAKLVEDQGI